MSARRSAASRKLTHGTPTRYLYAASGADGMGQWHLSIAQLVALAARLSLVLVEPCVRNGRIAPCPEEPGGRLPGGDMSAVGKRDRVSPLSTYFDTVALRAKFRPQYNVMLPFSDFILQHNGSGLLRASRLICGCKGCSRSCANGSIIPGMSKAARTPGSLMKFATGMPVLHLERYRFEYINHKLLPRDVLADARWGLRFAPVLETLGAALPRMLGLPDTYLALQWRSEGLSKNFSQCAQSLLASKRAAEEALGLPRDGAALLISDVPWNWNASLWENAMNRMADAERAHQAQQALQTLAKARLKKLDALPTMEDADPGALAVLDLILARQAIHLVACTAGDLRQLGGDGTGTSACHVCARYVSLYASWMVTLRRHNSTTHWLPIPPRQTSRRPIA